MVDNKSTGHHLCEEIKRNIKLLSLSVIQCLNSYNYHSDNNLQMKLINLMGAVADMDREDKDRDEDTKDTKDAKDIKDIKDKDVKRS